jgi:hypothetical protein
MLRLHCLTTCIRQWNYIGVPIAGCLDAYSTRLSASAFLELGRLNCADEAMIP